MNIVTVRATSKKIKGSINLAASKSESNRALIIQALCKEKINIENLSDSQDTRALQIALKGNLNEINIGHAGTAMRFLTAYCSIQIGQEVVLTGSERMKQRPIKILVDALNELGADITYLENEGYPPLKIKGKKLTGKRIEMDAGVSSQYISALMLIAPTMDKGLEIRFKGKKVSNPYLEMTKSMMRHFGADVFLDDAFVSIEPKAYNGGDIFIEADWSAASYWYSVAALADEAEIRINNLRKNSQQGDRAVADMFEKLGVHTQFEKNEITITNKRDSLPDFLEFNFINQPDLAQTLAVCLWGLNIRFSFFGLDNLPLKETDRILALNNELIKLGSKIKMVNQKELHLTGFGNKNTDGVILTYNDHRMAMAFAPLAMVMPEINIENPEVVEKSYPNFWNDLLELGFEIKQS